MLSRDVVQRGDVVLPTHPAGRASRHTHRTKSTARRRLTAAPALPIRDAWKLPPPQSSAHAPSVARSAPRAAADLRRQPFGMLGNYTAPESHP